MESRNVYPDPLTAGLLALLAVSALTISIYVRSLDRNAERIVDALDRAYPRIGAK